MPKLFEIFGYPIDDRSEEAQQNCMAARCPFMGCDCDGGGNRYLSQIDLSRNAALKEMFPNRAKLAAGVCSIQVKTYPKTKKVDKAHLGYHYQPFCYLSSVICPLLFVFSND